MTEKRKRWGGNSESVSTGNCKDGDKKKQSAIESISNHIYFYSGVDCEDILDLRQAIMEVTLDQKKMQIDFPSYNPEIFLHINSGGGYVTDGLNAMDLISNNSIPITTIIEGHSASAATFLSMSGSHRLIQKNSLMLFHRMRGGFWGTHSEFEDAVENWALMEKKIVDFYLKRSKITKKELLEMMKHEKYIDADQALKYGFVDAII